LSGEKSLYQPEHSVLKLKKKVGERGREISSKLCEGWLFKRSQTTGVRWEEHRRKKRRRSCDWLKTV